MEYSGKGPSGVWILTARPLKQGMSKTIVELSFDQLRLLGLEAIGGGFCDCRKGRGRHNERHETYTVR